MNARTFTIFALMVGGVLLVLLVTGGAQLVAAQAKPTVLSVPTLPALSPGGMGEGERPFNAPIMAGMPGSLASAAAPAATTANAQNVELVGHIGGTTEAVFVQGHYAYVGEGPRLTILDISDPASPTVVGKTHLLPGIVQGIYVSDGYAYVAADETGLRVVDVSNPVTPAEVGSYETWGNAYDVVVAGNYAYVADGDLWVIDVTDPVTPVAVSRRRLQGAAYGVAVLWPHAYIAADEAGLRVVDVSNPILPLEVGFYNTPGNARDVAMAFPYAYVADCYSGLRVVDVSTPTNPAEVGFYDTPGVAYGVAVAGDHAYIADGGYPGGLRVVDVSDQRNLTEVGFCDTPGDVRGVEVAADQVYIADGSRGLRVIDVSNLMALAEVGSYEMPGDAKGATVVGEYVYVANGVGGLQVVDVSDPAEPTKVGFYDTPYCAWDVGLTGDYAYVADDTSLRVIDVTYTSVLSEVGSISTHTEGIAVAGEYAYVAAGPWGLKVLHISNPAAPAILSSYDTGHAHDVVGLGSYVYVADSYGLVVVDVTYPTLPSRASSCDLEAAAYDVVVSGTYAYVVGGHSYPRMKSFLQAVDISTPISLTKAGSCEMPGRYAYGIAVSESTIYVADYDKGLQVIDASAPTDPALVGFYDTLGKACGVAAAGDYVYVADDEGGLLVLRYAGTKPWPLTDVTISGPTTGIADTACTFIATTTPPTATRPITYVWQATGQSSQTRVGGRSDAVRFTWPTPGTRAITVTATNALGTVTDTHVIVISAPPAAPVERVAVSGPTTGTVAIAYTFTATVGPLTATQPITYAWQASGQPQIVHAGGVSDKATFTWSTTGTQVITVAASNAWGSAHANHTIVISEPDTGDAYEPDDTCAQASEMPADGTVQQHTFHDYADEDWVRFTVVSGTTYIIQATSTGPLADTEIELHDGCAAPPLPAGDLDLGPGARLRWTAPQDTTYYLRVTNRHSGNYGPQASYELSIRAASPVGAAIVVAGRNDGRTLYPNINFAANRAARVFLGAGLSRANLCYLNSDPHPGGGLTPDAPATSANLQHAIETWAADKVGPDQQLYLYLVDHGGRDVFLTDGSGDRTTAADLDDWLATLEATTGCEVNVIVEACRSGSFIDESVVELVDDVSKEGRVVIASTSATQNAYALPGRGAYFSDSFFTALGGGADLWTAFRAGQQAVAAHGLWQTPWLDDDGNATPHVYDPDDGREARRRGLTRLGCSGIAPYIETVSGPAEIVDGRGTVRARVVDDLGVEFVWALVYPPSFEEPATTDEETVELALDSFVLLDGDGDGEHVGSYGDFMEIGEYRVVVYAKDSDDNLALPREVMVRTGWQVYLPLVCR